MPITLVSQNDATGVSAAPAVVLSTTSGNLLVLCFVTRNGSGTHDTVTDDQAQTWTQIGTPVPCNGGGGYVSLWYCVNTYTGSLTVTCGLSASDTWYVNLSQWAGQHASPYSTTDTSSATSSTTHVMGGTGLSVVSGDLLIGAAVQGGSITDEAFTGGTPFTALQFTGGANVRQWWGYRIAAGTESNVQGNWTQSASSVGARMAKFVQSVAGGPAVPVVLHQLSQQGIA
jgi:hypothetical protein